MAISLASIYRDPIKGFSPQSLAQISIEEGRPLAWDRAFAIENGASGFDPASPGHLSKIHFLMLMKQPELAALRTSFDDQTGSFSMIKGGLIVATGNLFEPESMNDAFNYLAEYCTKPLRGSPRLLHAKDHAFTDAAIQDVTLMNLASIREISERAGADLDPIRFRGNLYIEGAAPWQEHDWVGEEIKIGKVTFRVRKRTERCAAVNANPLTGERDQNIPKLLMQEFGHTDCGIHLMPLENGGIRTGDQLTY